MLPCIRCRRRFSLLSRRVTTTPHHYRDIINKHFRQYNPASGNFTAKLKTISGPVADSPVILPLTEKPILQVVIDAYHFAGAIAAPPDRIPAATATNTQGRRVTFN